MSRKVFSPNEGVLDTNLKLVYNLVFKDNLQQKSTTVGLSAVPVPTIPLSRRISIIIFNNGTEIVYIGASDVSVANGFPLLPMSTIQLSMEEEVIVYAISPTTTNDIRSLEGA